MNRSTVCATTPTARIAPTFDECYDALQEEIADVMLCVSEYLDCKGPDYLNCVMRMQLKKHERWERRLKEVGK